MFAEFYFEISASIERDEQFEALLKNTWNLWKINNKI